MWCWNAAGHRWSRRTRPAGGTSVGKRYFSDAIGIEVLGSKAGKGSLSANGVPLALKEAKALPASD